MPYNDRIMRVSAIFSTKSNRDAATDVTAAVAARARLPRRARIDAEATLSTVARLIASGAAQSKADLVPAAGMARTTVSAAVDELLNRGVVRIAGTRPTPGRGRPADRLALSPRGGHVLLADVGARGAHLAVLDLSQRVVAHEHVDLDVRDGPEPVLDIIEARLDALRAAGSAGGARPGGGDRAARPGRRQPG